MTHTGETNIRTALHKRWGVLCAMHLPTVLLLIYGRLLLALLYLFVLHMSLLWGTLYPHSRLFGPVLRRLPTRQQQVWLTIDDGPSADTAAILKLLERYQAKATFFLVGERAQRHPELVREVIQAGNEVANHSATHPAPWFWLLPPHRMQQEIERGQSLLAELTGRPPRWFRAVVGHANPFVEPILKGLGLQRVSWTARGYDGVDGDVVRVTTKLLQQVKPGAILLLHEGAAHGQCVAIIERVLQELERRGYQAVLPA